MAPHRMRRAGVTALALGLLVACGGADDVDGKGAAEPADAPEPAERPAGTTRQVAPAPQGIVYDPETDSLAVAVRRPDRLLILDPASLEKVLTVRLPGKVRHLQATAGGGTVLAPSEQADTLLEVDPETGTTRGTRVRRYPHDAAGAPNGDLVVAEEFAGAVSVIREGTVVHTFDDLRQPGGVAVDGETAIVVDVEDYTLTSYDLASLRREARVRSGNGPTHVALVDDNRVAVADTRGDQILVYTVDPLRQVSQLALDGAPYGLAADPVSGTLWVTLTGRNELVGIDVSTDTPAEIARYPTVRQPNTVAVSPGATTLWITGTADGAIQRIER